MKEKMSLGERIFVFSDAGQREIAKEDWQSISAEERAEGMIIYNELKRNGGIINLEDKKISLIEKSHKKAKTDSIEIPITLTDENIRRGFRKMPKDKREDILQMSLKAKDIKIKQKIQARENRPSDITPVANLSKKSWKKLPKNGREAVLQKICSLQNELAQR